LLGSLPLHPLLFAAYAVLFLYAQNIELVRLSEVFPPLAWSLGGAAVLVGITALAMRSAGRGALIASAVVVGFFGYGHLTGLLGEEVPGWLVMVGLVGLLGGVTALAVIRYRRMPSLTGGLNAAGAVLVLFALATIVPYHAQAPVRAVGTGGGPSGLQATRATQRDIYYLVFDRYGSASALQARFGITDNDLPAWLAQRGFQVAEHAHANYSRTTLSLASVLNLEYLDEVAAAQGPDSESYSPLHEMLQEHVVGRFLHEQGYRYLHVGSWFNPTRSVRIADMSLEHDSTTEFEAVLYETTALPALASVLPQGEPVPPEDEKHVAAARFQFRALQRIIAEPGPKFVLAHVLLPHDPYTFDEEGNYVPVSARDAVPVERQFRAQLEYTNRELRRIVEQLLAQPESERPIIIIQADEGPFPARYDQDELRFDWGQATQGELESKFGILNAFYLPPEPDGPAEPRPYATMSSVNTFRLVLERYFGVELPLLADRAYTSRSPKLPYDLTEITELLPSP
jgi:hypothetical protein